MRNKDYIRRFQLYHNPPRWSTRWWLRLPGRIITSPFRLVRFTTERVAVVLWKSEFISLSFFSVYFGGESNVSEALERVLFSSKKKNITGVFRRWLWMKVARAPEAEVAAMRYIRAHTTVPVPRPWLMFTWGGLTRIIMDRVPGTTLEAIWYDLSPAERDGYVQQLADIVSQLRSLQSPFGDRICSAAGGAFMDHRISTVCPVGPFADEDGFNEATLMYVPEPHPSREELLHHIRHPIVFTHNDLAMRNVMVRGGKITGVIDWEGSGWFPAHWEYVKAHDTNGEGDNVVGAFRPYTDRVVPAYPLELEADRRWVAPPRVVYRHT